LAIAGNNYTFSSLFSVKNLYRSYQYYVKIMVRTFLNFVPKIFEVVTACGFPNFLIKTVKNLGNRRFFLLGQNNKI